MAVEHEYYGKKAISASALKTFLSKDPSYFKKYYDGLIKIDPTDKMKQGTAVHAAILEPEVFASRYILGPDVAKNTREWKDFVAANPDKEVLKPEEWEYCHTANRNVMENPFLRELFKHPDTQFEKDVYWTDFPTGLECKALADAVNPTLGVIIDVKTTGSNIYSEDGYDFRKDIFTMNYDIQALHYMEGFKCPMFVFVPVENKPPYRVGLVKMDAKAYTRARTRYLRAMKDVEEHFKTNKWPGLEVYGDSRGIIEASVPRWMK